jgi:hypothetical protein
MYYLCHIVLKRLKHFNDQVVNKAINKQTWLKTLNKSINDEMI